MRQYRPFLFFLLRFFGAYAVLTIVYRFYLDRSAPGVNQIDGFTWSVARQVRWLLDFLGYPASIEAHPTQASIKLIVENQYVARVVEGCNALSVMILFTAFLFAFKSTWLKTVSYIIGGILVLHLFNIWRIALLAIALLRFPDSGEMLHGVIFPAVIYGTVLLLWVIWVNNFANHVRRN